MRRKASFQREAFQQRLTQRVNGADVHPARRIKHLREQPPRGRQRRQNLVIIGAAAQQIAKIGLERGLIHRCPAAETAIDADRHFRRRGIGEGNAQQSVRCRSAQQQAQHAVGQNLGLAGARRCPDPDGGGRIGGGTLLYAHTPSPDHSRTRARWS